MNQVVVTSLLNVNYHYLSKKKENCRNTHNENNYSFMENVNSGIIYNLNMAIIYAVKKNL